MANNKRLSPIVIVSENERKSTNSINLDDKNLEKHDSTYTDFLVRFFAEICEKVELIDKLEDLPSFIEKNRDFIVFSIWSGSNSRSRMALVPAICESLEISYIGADCYAKTICQDKFISRNFAKRVGFNIPKAILIERDENIKEIGWLDFPIVLKPNMEGTSIGIRKIYKVDDFLYHARLMLEKYDNSIIAEEFVPGREVAIIVYGGISDPKILGAVEVVHRTIENYYLDKIFDVKGKNSKNIKRVSISEEVSNQVYLLAKKAFCSLGKMDFLRIDGRLQPNGEFYFIEFSPIPNFSNSSSIAALSNDNDNKAVLVAKEIISINMKQNSV